MSAVQFIGRLAKATIRQSLNAIGYDIVRYSRNNPRARLAELLIRQNISLVLDVGANRGDFAWSVRQLGYRGQIISFEPIQDVFRELQNTACRDKAWQAVNIGLGDRNEERLIHVSANSQSSSLLPMLDAHLRAAPESRYERDELVTIRRLDEVLAEHQKSDETIFLKVDAQGFEKNIVDGAEGILETVAIVQLECSLVPLYESADLIESLIGHMRRLGYDPIDTLPVFFDPNNGYLMQPDILFLRREYRAR